MSSKSKRASTSTPVPSPITVTTSTSSTTRSARVSSPCSPTRSSRLQEKVELQCLNDRLACYIDRVRNLETENSRLIVEVQTSRETVTREISNIKSMYDTELNDARKLLDSTAREKAKLEIDIARLFEENEDLTKRLDKKTKDCTMAENNARMYENRYNDINSKYGTACSERAKALNDLKDLEKELQKLRDQLAQARKNLEEETLARVDLENNLQSLKEELSFKDQIHSQELTEALKKRQVEISEIDGRLSEEYEAKLQQSLQELREQYEEQMRLNREEIDQLYDSKIKSLEMAAMHNNNSTQMLKEELRQTRHVIDNLNSKISELESANASLQARIRDLERILESERLRHNDERASLEAELQRLRDEMANQLQEYQDLMDIKVSLDLELAAYDKLLKGEEHRLNITPGGSSTSTAGQSMSQTIVSSQRSISGRRTPSSYRAGAKRKHTMLEESMDRQLSDYTLSSSSKGDIEITEQDPEGKFVKLYNKGSREIAIGGWQLVRTAGNDETSFKFHRSVKIEPKSTVTVWSSDGGATHDPPTTIVMKSQKWFIGDKFKTQLMNSNGEEVALSESIKNVSASHISRHRVSGLGGGVSSRYATEFYQQGGDPTGAEKCFIM